MCEPVRNPRPLGQGRFNRANFAIAGRSADVPTNTVTGRVTGYPSLIPAR